MSIWLAEAAPPRTPLVGERAVDVAIVGGGIAGVASAYFLARRGATVALVEARSVAAAASGRNAGFLLAGVAENFAAASRRYGEGVASRVWEVTRRNQALVKEAVAREGIACDLEWNGSLQLAGDDEEWTEMLAGAVALLRRGHQLQIDEAARSVCVATDGAVDPARLVHGLVAAAERAGATVFEGTVATGVTRGVVRAARGSLVASSVLVCTNAYAPRLVDVRIRPVRGQMLATAPLGQRVLSRPVYAHRGYRYWRQTVDRRVLVGGWRDLAVAEEVGEEERLNDRVQAALDGFLRDANLAAPVTHRWAGIMGFSHDGLPYIGRLPSGVFVCAGFTGHGMGFGLAAGELAAALVSGDTPREAELFDPGRP